MSEEFGVGWFFGVFCGFIIVLLITICIYEPQKEFKSEVKLTPSIELQIVNNKVDTLFVYKIK